MVAHPIERCDLVAQTEVRGHARNGQESFDAETVVERNADHSIASEGAPVKDGGVLAAKHEAASMDPDHDRQSGSPACRPPDVEREIIFATGLVRPDQRRDLFRRRPRLRDAERDFREQGRSLLQWS